MDSQQLCFETIDLARNFLTCVQFRADSYFVSFGSLTGFSAEMGPDNVAYLARMERKIANLPTGNCHIWQGKNIVGQTEMRILDSLDIGYVNLFYLIPDLRAKGHGRELHQHACCVFKGLGMQTMQLSVSPQNKRALRFYEKMGWTSLGPRPGREKMLLMEFNLAAST